MPEKQDKLKPVLLKALLSLVFAASWVFLIRGLAEAALRLKPAAEAGHPAAIAVIALFVPLAAYLFQGLFYLPRREMEPGGFIRARLSFSPLVFLPLPFSPRVEPGPALEVVAGPEEREALLTEVRAHLSAPLTLRLSLLLESRSPVDVLLDRLTAWSVPLISPLARLAALILGPGRLFLRLWGYFFFLILRAGDEPGQASDLLKTKRALAFDLLRRERELFVTAENSPLPPDPVRLEAIRLALARVFAHNNYGREPGQAGPPSPEADKLAETIYNAPYLASRYYGAYLDFPVTFNAPTPDDLYDEGRRERPEAFYPPELGQEMERAALLSGRRERLTRILRGRREEGPLILDGRLLTTWEAEAEIGDLKDQLLKLNKRLATHHRRCRSSCLSAARDLGGGWPETLRTLAVLLHFAEHGLRALSAATLELKADFSKSALLSAATGLFLVVRDVHERLALLKLPAGLRPEEFDRWEILPEPSEFNIKAWMKEWRPFVDDLAAALGELRAKALTGLLVAEDYVGGLSAASPFEIYDLDLSPVDGFIYPYPAPLPPERVYSPASRFKVDPGRVILAAVVVGLLVWQSQTLWQSKLYIYNGLGRDLIVLAGGLEVKVPAYGRGLLKVRPGETYEISAQADRQIVERFTRSMAPQPSQEVYNIAGAAPLMEWISPRGQGEDRSWFLGRPRWLISRAQVLFADPPAGGEEGETLVLSGYGRNRPSEMLSAFDDENDQAALIRLHARWDRPGSPWFWQWQILLTGQEDSAAVIMDRLKDEPNFLDNWVRWLEGTSKKRKSES